MTTDAWLRRGQELRTSGAHREAEDCFARAIDLDPTNLEAWHGLGSVCQHQGKIEEAIAAYQHAVAIAPHDATAQVDMALAWASVGQLALAVSHLRAAIRIDPRRPEVYRYLAETLARQKDWQQSGAAYYECLKRNPRDIPAALGVAQALLATDQAELALRAMRRALAISPDSTDLLVSAGHLLLRLERGAEAITLFDKAARIAPEHVLARRGLAAALEAVGRTGEATALRRRLAEEFPLDGDVQGDLGKTLLRQACFPEAEAVLRTAARLRPFDHEIAEGLAIALVAQSKGDEAAVVQARAGELKPVPNETLRAQLSALLYDTDPSPRDLRERTQAIVSPFDCLSPAFSTKDLRADRPLRIGWLSSDFRYHVVAANLRPVLENLDRANFIPYFYADTKVDDPLARYFRSYAAAWRTVEGLSDAEVAAIIRQDEIDILVILAGRFDQNRPVIAGRRAAPLQVSFHDPGTSGLTSMNYLISDRYLTPPGSKAAFTERVLRLPSFYIRSAPDEQPLPNPLPMLGGGELTLGSFSNPAKITPRTLDLWASLLRALVPARLILRYYDSYGAADVQSRVLRSFSDRGIDSSRIVLQTATTNWGEHLAQYHGIDIALDPLPFSGSTTTFEALWMGVPVVTKPGETMVSRWSASMLHALGLDSFIARSDEDFIGIVQQCAGDPDRLAELRKALRGRLKSSPLCDGRLRGRQIARLFRAIWRRHCAYLPEGAR